MEDEGNRGNNDVVVDGDVDANDDLAAELLLLPLLLLVGNFANLESSLSFEDLNLVRFCV